PINELDPEVILLDAESAGSGVRALLRRFGPSGVRPVVAMLYGHGDADQALGSVLLGALSYISKSIAVAAHALAEAIWLIANGGAVIVPVLAARLIEVFDLAARRGLPVRLDETEQSILDAIAGGGSQGEAAALGGLSAG